LVAGNSSKKNANFDQYGNELQFNVPKTQRSTPWVQEDTTAATASSACMLFFSKVPGLWISLVGYWNSVVLQLCGIPRSCEES
jgi:hypothetical protein